MVGYCGVRNGGSIDCEDCIAVWFKVVCAKFPKLLDYIEKTILDPVKEKFVRYWVDKNLHMGNTTTNIVESTHARLKKYLSSSMSDLSTN